LATIQLCFVTVPYLQYIFSVNTAGMNKLKFLYVKNFLPGLFL